MSNTFSTNDINRALEYIRIHLEEGYFVSAYKENAKTVFGSPMFKITASNVDQSDCQWK